ncbi:MAG: hypothetical protein KH031_09645 [Clostridiales bacterium]|nr:hypothetical protein [Clostridiales bacterium]
MYFLIDVYGEHVLCNKEYKSLEEAKEYIDAEFNGFTSDEHNIEYGNHCEMGEDGLSAWARYKGHYRIWRITKVLP